MTLYMRGFGVLCVSVCGTYIILYIYIYIYMYFHFITGYININVIISFFIYIYTTVAIDVLYILGNVMFLASRSMFIYAM